MLLLVVYPVTLDDGPRWSAWYEAFGGGAAVDVGRRMVVDLTQSIDRNAATTTRNGRIFKCGFVLMLVGLAGCVAVALVH